MGNNSLFEFKNSKEWIEFDKYYTYSSFMKKVGFYKYEDPNTNFLKSILNESFNGTYYALRLLIELISRQDKVFDNINLMSEYKIDIKEITPRKAIEKLKPDLLINITINSVEYVIVIEAKLHSLESIDQCKNYETIISNKYSDPIRKIYLFLDIDKGNKISSDKFIRITYSDLLKFIYTPCSFRLNDDVLLAQLEEYIKSFVEFYKYDNINYKYIPLSYEGEELTLNLWNKYNEVLNELFNNHKILDEFYKANSASLKAFIINTIILHNQIKISKSLQTKLESLLNRTNKINFLNDAFYNNVDFVYELLKDITTKSELKIKSIHDLPDSIININNWKLIVSSKEIDSIPSSRKDYYRLKKGSQTPIVIGGEEYLYCTFINSDDIDQLISSVLEVYPIYKNKIGRNFKL